MARRLGLEVGQQLPFAKSPLFFAGVALAAGVYVGSLATLSAWIWAAAALLGLVRGLRSDAALLAATFALGGFIAVPHPSLVPQPPINARLHRAFSVTVEEVRQRTYSVDHLLRPLGDDLSALQIKKLLWRAAPVDVPAYEDSVLLPRYGIGDTLDLVARLRRPRERRNPNGFSESLYLWTRQIDARTTGTVFVRQWRPASQPSPARILGDVRHSINGKLEVWAGARAGLAKALLLGDRSGLDWEFMARVQSIGVAHVMAVSGLHAGFIAAFVITLLRMLLLPTLARVVLTTIILILYAAVTGAPASVVRAVIMISLYLLGSALGRPGRNWNILGAAAMLGLMLDPRSLFTPGFALSFSAVAGIFAFHQPMLDAALDTRPGQWLSERPGGRAVTSLLLLTFAAQLGSLPVTLALFHGLPVMGFLANLLIVPVAGLAIFALLAALVSALVLPPLATTFGHAAWGLLSFVEISVDRLAALGTPQIVTGRPAGLVLALLAAILLLLPRLSSGGIRRAVGSWAVALLVLANGVIWTGAFSAPGLKVTFLDVGQGDAIHIATPDGRHILIDTGPRQQQWDAGRMIVAPYLRSKGITRLDLLVISHAHADHAGGLEAVLDNVQVRELWLPPTAPGYPRFAEAVKQARSGGTIITTPPAGTLWRLGAVSLDVLAPDSVMLEHHLGANEGSWVLKLRYGNSSLLLTGDIESRAEYRLLSYGDALQADWMKVAHHGGNTSSAARFLQRVAPQGAVISVGARNRYHHPSTEALNRFSSAGIPLLRTDLHGAVTLFSDGESWSVTTMLG
ncbi:MAG: DNA internalization-related competence protein ComEC/Rec2, partial [Candidatus Marinimicrobia bacterium]|nr:DNA internalization-related competence protein ComEC/Rec2 [Candidatus Neomarinimicrobiota bacterium]